MKVNAAREAFRFAAPVCMILENSHGTFHRAKRNTHRKKYRTRQASTLRSIAIQVAPLNKTHVRVPAQPHEALTRSVGPRGGSVARRWRYSAPLQRTHTNLIKHTEIRVLGYGRPRPRETRFKTRDSRVKWSRRKLLYAERRFVIIPEQNDNVSRKIKNNESQIIQEAWHFDARLAQGPLAIARIEIAVFGDRWRSCPPRLNLSSRDAARSGSALVRRPFSHVPAY